VGRMSGEAVEVEARIAGARLLLKMNVVHGTPGSYESPPDPTEIDIIEATDLDEWRALTEKECSALATSDELLDHVNDLFARHETDERDLDAEVAGCDKCGCDDVVSDARDRFDPGIRICVVCQEEDDWWAGQAPE